MNYRRLGNSGLKVSRSVWARTLLAKGLIKGHPPASLTMTGPRHQFHRYR